MHSRSLASKLLLASLALTPATFAADPTDPRALVDQAAQQPLPTTFTPTKLTRNDYLPLIAANLDFFKQFQRQDGAIIDPAQHKEVQYSTPAFALAAATLATHADRKDLLPLATRAFSCALTALTTHHAADGHSDFYIPLLVHTYDLLKETANPQTLSTWQSQFRSIQPEKTYRMELIGMNWNIVSSSGELLRRQAHLVADDQLTPQWTYLENCLKGHLHTISPVGLIEDQPPADPLAYDAFSRLWLEDMMASNAYTGDSSKTIAAALEKGALSGLLLLSPSGEWPNGGRSALHNWNEAENIVINEIAATREMHQNHPEQAKMFKRAAHLALQSMQRWVRPTGELYIIKNRAEPTERFAYESYSGHSQYNLLPMAMLALAYQHADDTIPERPTPAESASYVFDLRTPFHKIAAASNGYYAYIDTNADPHYNATGLQRVHRSGVPFPALSDSVAPDRTYEPKSAPKAALTPGLAWQDKDGNWLSLGAFTHESKHTIANVDLTVTTTDETKADFTTDYTLATPNENTLHLLEHYTLSKDGLTCTTTLTGQNLPQNFRAQFPLLLDDGKNELPHTLTDTSITINNHNSLTTFTLAPNQTTAPLTLTAPTLINHNGHLQPRNRPPLRPLPHLHHHPLHDKITPESNRTPNPEPRTNPPRSIHTFRSHSWTPPSSSKPPTNKPSNPTKKAASPSAASSPTPKASSSPSATTSASRPETPPPTPKSSASATPAAAATGPPSPSSQPSPPASCAPAHPSSTASPPSSSAKTKTSSAPKTSSAQRASTSPTSTTPPPSPSCKNSSSKNPTSGMRTLESNPHRLAASQRRALSRSIKKDRPSHPPRKKKKADGFKSVGSHCSFNSQFQK